MNGFKLIEIPYTEENLLSYDYIMHKAGYWGGNILDEFNPKSRLQSIHDKGFDLYNFAQPAPTNQENVVDYSKMKVGVK